MSEVDAALFEKASALAANAPLRELLSLAIECAVGPASAVIAQKLQARATLLPELTACLRGDDAGARRVALDFVARLEPVPADLAPAVCHALRFPLDDEPLGDEVLLALMATWPLSAQLVGFRGLVQDRRDAALEASTALARSTATDQAARDRAELVLKVADAVLKKMNSCVTELDVWRAQSIGELSDLVSAGAFDEVHRRLHELVPDNHQTDGVPERGAMLEGVGDELARRHALADASSWAFREALSCFEQYASWSSSGGEGTARMVDVNRLRVKLGH